MSFTDLDYVEIFLKFNGEIVTTKEHFQKLFEYLRTKPSKLLSSYFQKIVYKEFHEHLTFQQVYDTIEDFEIRKKPSKENVMSLIDIPIDKICDENIKKIINNNSHTFFYNKIKVPLYSFPSTTEIYDSVFEERIIFKINNRLYLNLCKVQYVSEVNKVYYHVNIHYQYNKNNDIKYDVSSIQAIIDLITSF
jgi:hypothetical protein